MVLPFLSPCVRLAIVEHFDPITAFNYAIASKEHWELCRHIIQKHTELFAEGRVIDTSQEDVTGWSALKEVLLDPRKGWYIRELNWNPSLGRQEETSYDAATNQHIVNWSLSEEDAQLLKGTARAVGALYASEESGTTEKNGLHHRSIPKTTALELLEQCLVEHRTENAAVAILIHYLPNLETLRATDIQTDCLELFMEQIALASKDPEKAEHLPLRRLKTFAIAHWDSEGSCSPGWAWWSLSLPSLKTVVASTMGGDFAHEVFNDAMAKDLVSFSNIKELYLYRCQFDVSTLDRILSGIKALERFTYQCGGAIVSYSSAEPRRVIESLARNAAHSLETLFLDHDSLENDHGEDDAASVSLKEFKKLKVLTCNWKMLWPEEDIDMGRGEALEDGFYADSDSLLELDIRDILPESIQELYFTGEFDEEDRQWERLVQPFESQNNATPNLVKVRASKFDPDNPQERILFTVGDAQQPNDVYSHPLMALLDDHGYT